MNIDLLKSLLEADDMLVPDMLIDNIDADKYYKVTDNKNFWMLVPKNLDSLTVCLVSHIDTVRGGYTYAPYVKGKKIKKTKNEDRVSLIDNGTVISNSYGVLGADDRAGVYMISDIYNKLDKLPVILLTNYEESGGIGVQEFCNRKKELAIDKVLKNISFFIEFDREGVDEYVCYSASANTEMQDIADSYGLKESIGSFSDVATLSEYTEVAHLNLSACYYNQHTSREILVYSLIDTVIDRYIKVINEMLKLNKVFEDSGSYYSTYNSPYGGNYEYMSYGSQYKNKPKKDEDYEPCWNCLDKPIIEDFMCQDCLDMFNQHNK